MPETRFSIPLYKKESPVIGCRALGNLSAQRAALAELLSQEGWPVPEREATGRPRMGTEFCSLSHGGGWAMATRSPHPIGIDVEAATPRLETARRRFVGPDDQPVLDRFGDNLDALCRIWTAKEAAFKAFGTGVDFLTGLRWTGVHSQGAQILAVAQNVPLTLHWKAMMPSDDKTPTKAPQTHTRIWVAICGAQPA